MNDLRPRVNAGAVREGVLVALSALRSNRLRAGLTVLGIVIGVATVIAIAALLGGVRASVMEEFEALGPKNFIVSRYDKTKARIVDTGDGPSPWEGKPPVTLAESEILASLPSVASATPQVNASVEVRYGTRLARSVTVQGNGGEWPNFMRGDFPSGRNFLPSEEARSANVVVLSEDLAGALFEGADPVGRNVMLGSAYFQVVGVYRRAPSLFSGMAGHWVAVPASTAVKRLNAWSDWLSVLIVPAPGVSQDQAMDEVAGALRMARGLRPDQEDNFSLVRQEAFLDIFQKVTGSFFLVMLLLSSIGLIVGGVGVIAIMTISVTERTREIGIRKALGARRRDILWQFLFEAVTVTVLGGAAGLVLGAAMASLLGLVLPFPVIIPLWAVLSALAVSALSGIGFGIYPAYEAARLDPVEALRYE